MFGNPETTTGGNALKFYSSVRIDVRKSTPIKDGDDVIGKLDESESGKEQGCASFPSL